MQKELPFLLFEDSSKNILTHLYTSLKVPTMMINRNVKFKLTGVAKMKMPAHVASLPLPLRVATLSESAILVKGKDNAEL